MNGCTKKMVVLGLGQRGNIYATFAKTYPEKFELVAIIENDPQRYEYAKREYPTAKLFKDYKDFLKEEIEADIVAVATQDIDHKEHSIALMEKGYDLLLEKPIANTQEDCMAIYEASKTYGRKVIVCHVLRYTPFYSTVKKIIDSGKLGEVITIHASESVGYFHQAHSFVRGPWQNKKESSPMILAKCCHDMDILRYLMGEECVAVSSYGDLYYFNEAHAPENSANYCSQCPLTDCIYKAQRLYTEQARQFAKYFTTKELTDENILADLEGTQYDKCVYKSNNDVVDHQVTIMQFKKGKTACHTMTAFSREIYRDLKVHGTKAELVGVVEDNYIEVRYFGGEVEKINVDTSKANVGGHMGGDFYMMESLYKDLNGEKADGITYLDVSIDSHLMSFSAETSRLLDGNSVKIKR
ncbi:MAG: Gfo/Idh/MocA family oxidoreductase [Clostridiales bacterium]|nr:Gfo/Idh/MocA family oxidoreductase [Clostridiales bacterium]